MLIPGRLDWDVWANAEFPAGDDDWIGITENGSPLDFSGLLLTLQVRQYEGQAGDPLLSISTATTGDLIELKDGDPTLMRWVVRKSTMLTLETAPPANPPSLPRVKRPYDFMIGSEVYLDGFFNLRTGVTRP